MAEARNEEGLIDYLTSSSYLLEEFVDSQDRIIGLASMSFREFDAGIMSVGGLIGGHQARNPSAFSKNWVGALAAKPEGPKRWMGELIRKPRSLADWAQTQVAAMVKANLSSSEQHIACINAAEFGASPIDLFQAQLGRTLSDSTEVFLILEQGFTIYMPITSVAMDRNHCTIDNIRNNRSPFSLNAHEIDYGEKTIERIPTNEPRPSYYLIPEEICENDVTLLGCLIKITERNSRKWAAGCVSAIILAKYTGNDSPKEHLKSGQDLPCVACWFKLEW